jgi:hypothetical protein
MCSVRTLEEIDASLNWHREVCRDKRDEVEKESKG